MPFRNLLLAIVVFFTPQVSYSQVQYVPRLNGPSAISLQRPVGTVEGALSVSSSGAASYTIPIKVPPGINGMEPKLSLVYNSQAGNGQLGFGWSLSGLSAITRNSRDVIHEGVCKPIEWNNNDQYYLDGSKLVTIAGEHGNHNAVYTTEQEVGTRVTQQWMYNQTNSPSWFSAQTKEGTIMHYGELGNSRLFASHVAEILSWKINSVEDIDGNKVEYEYVNYRGEQVLRKISYGYNAGAPRYSVLLDYDVRKDKNLMFVSGSSFASELLLTKIKIIEYYTENILKQYSMDYAWDGFHSVLQSIRESGINNTDEYNETQFIYGDEGNVAIQTAGIQVNAQRLIEENVVTGINYTDDRISIGRGHLVGDFNGDGISDVAEKVYTFAANGNINLLHSLNIKIKDPHSGNFTAKYQYYLGLPYTTNESAKAFRDENFLVGDINGDGADDIIIGIRKAGHNNEYNELKEIRMITDINKYLDGTLSNPTEEIKSADTNRNMITDALNPVPSDMIVNYNYMYLADFDGNGLVDLLTALSPDPYHSTTSYLQMTTFRHFDAKIGQIILPIYFMDVQTPGVNFTIGQKNVSFPDFNYGSLLVSPYNFNGGLKQELIVINGPTTYVYGFEIQGNNCYLSKIFDVDYPTTWHRTTLGDFNGDGNTDLLVRYQDQNTWEIAYSTGTAFNVKSINLCVQPNVYYPTRSHISPNNTIIITADMNNDGLADISYVNVNDHIQYGSSPGTTSPAVPVRITCSNQLVINYNKGDNTFDCQYIDFLTSPDSLKPVLGKHQLLGDFNGDGKLDILWNVNSNVKKYLTVGKFKNEYTLRAVRNGLGMVNHVKYLPLTTTQDANHYHFSGNLSNSWPLNRLKIPLWTVQKIGRHTSNTANATSEVYYRYDDLHVLKDGRGMLGFGVTFTHDVATGAIKKSFNSGFAPYGRYLPDHTGTEEGYIVGSNYTALRHTDNYRRYQNVIPGKTYSLQEFKNIQEDLQSGAKVITNTTFDNSTNNNPIEITTEYPGLFTTVKKIAYAPATDTRTTLPFKPESIEETSTRQGAPAVTTKARYEYQNGHLYRQTVHDGLPNAITTTYAYDNFGNTTSQTVSAAGVPSRTESYGYDPTRRFRIQTTNALGQAAQTKYDSDWGVVTEQKAFGGLTTQYEYDPFLRLKKTTYPEGFSITENLVWAGSANSINDARYIKETNSPTKGKTQILFNVFGQPVEEKGDLWNASGTLIRYNKETGYDPVGRKVSETSVTGQNDRSIIRSSYDYDRQGRLWRTRQEYDNIRSVNYYTTEMSYFYSGGNLKTQTTKPSGAVTYTLTDATGKVIESKDENGVLKFAYDSWGNTWKTLLDNLPVLTHTYDDYNRPTGTKDLSAGNTSYEYDALGQLIKEKDALQQQTVFGYDLLGRKKTITFPEGKLEYEYYNNPAHPQGNQLRFERRTTAAGALEEQREYLYNNYGRVEEARYTQSNLSPRFTKYGYDNFGRISHTTLSSGIDYTTEYNTGAVWRVMQGGDLVFEIGDINGPGQALEILRGDGLTSTHTYEFGQLLRKEVPGYQDYELTMSWDTGLITRRRDHLANRHEDFTYDALKLATATIGANGLMVALPPQTQVYGANSLTAGNFRSKSDIGDFTYRNYHAVNYTNNTAGAIPTQRQDITYASYKRPLTIQENGKEARIEYGTDGERRVMRFYSQGILQYTKHYLPDGVEVVEDIGGLTLTITPLPGADGVGAYMVKAAAPYIPELAPAKIYYPYTDHLGSITLLTEIDRVGNVVAAHRQAFDPWGRRRNPTTWETDDNALPPGDMRYWLRGFTGHEHLDDFGLINMNARLYDPKLGRMLSPDILIGAPNSPLGYNRYVYALNNPISNIDPTGNEPITLSAVLIGAAIGAAVAGTAYTLQTTTMQGGLQKNWNIGEFLKATAIGAASGAVSGAIGSAFGQTGTFLNELGRAYAHGVNGAVFSGIQGGDPLTGFVTSFVSTGISHGLEGAGAAELTSGFNGALFNAGMGAAFSAAQGGDPWIGAAGSLIGYLANQDRQNRIRAAQERIRRQYEVGFHDTKMLGELYWHFQFGGGERFTVDAYKLDFSYTNINELGLSGMTVGETRDVNLFAAGVRPNALAFGKLSFTYVGVGRFHGQPMFRIANNPFDFDYQQSASFARNAGTFVGGAIFGRFFNQPVSITPNLFFGGPFDVRFKGLATVPAR